MKINSRESLLIILVILLSIGLFAKNIYLDPIGEVNGLDAQFKGDIEQLIDQEYKQGIIKYQLVKITAEETNGIYLYVGKIRKYLFGVIPFSDVNVKIEYNKEGVKNES